ncbi:hypothetical protein H5410_024991 [Solanum commersonii]|uniref:Uncharacterized protein n=1 Tax=Solanum commersonii TaxID=4109 RepID=A0A9J5YRV3_SOLCO|nr:hypothetical protein H5410_024991 [Solanum commersonii]
MYCNDFNGEKLPLEIGDNECSDEYQSLNTVNWSLAYVVAVVESKQGYETLRRSAYLVKGVRSIALSMVLFYGLMMGCSLGGCSMYLVIIGTAKGGQWRFLKVILLQIFQSLELGYVMMNQYLVRNAVLYTYCKDLNDQKLSGDNEFGSEYVSLNMVAENIGNYYPLPPQIESSIISK